MKIIINVLLFFIICNPSISHCYDGLSLEECIGRLVVLHDENFSYQKDDNPFGSAILYDDMVDLYINHVKKMPEYDRVAFFWFAMWHLDFDGHYMELFQELVYEDCGDVFMNKLEKYIEKEKQLQRSKSRLYLSEKVLAGLIITEKNHRKLYQ
ncbi:hypothetical protein [Desulfogranum japonicum]|uniref:hypothetical protein n=1 Tax=Desulfogranum japonicum TaxID=231447 RepID=UPI000490250B|nr:hypothetical protein [Desulfogranum japonicum]